MTTNFLDIIVTAFPKKNSVFGQLSSLPRGPTTHKNANFILIDILQSLNVARGRGSGLTQKCTAVGRFFRGKGVLAVTYL